jgi:DNA-directed RNA polymerase subunit M/transcription elongation factor TFIIS
MLDRERKAVRKALQRQLKNQTAEKYEIHIYKMCKRIVKRAEEFVEEGSPSCRFSEYVTVEMLYPKIAYEKVGQLLVCKDRPERENILNDIKNDVTGFDTYPYEVYKTKQKEECSFAAQGPKVEEGEFPCRNPKCKSKRCYWYQLQTRSGDEGMTIFVTCIKCKTRYKKND